MWATKCNFIKHYKTDLQFSAAFAFTVLQAVDKSQSNPFHLLYVPVTPLSFFFSHPNLMESSHSDSNSDSTGSGNMKDKMNTLHTSQFDSSVIAGPPVQRCVIFIYISICQHLFFCTLLPLLDCSVSFSCHSHWH